MRDRRLSLDTNILVYAMDRERANDMISPWKLSIGPSTQTAF